MITDKSDTPSNARIARQMLRAHRYGALSTLSQKFDGHPFGSITPYLVDHDGTLLILVSGLAEHTKNILRDSRVSLVTHDQKDPHIQTQGRVTLVGNASHDPHRDRCGERYLRYFPEARRYFEMADFNFFRIVPSAVRYVGGFANAHWVNIEKYRLPPYPLMTQEVDLLKEFDQQHRDILPKRLSLADGTEATLIGVDYDGFDVRIDETTHRIDFAEPVLDADQARAAILTRPAKN